MRQPKCYPKILLFLLFVILLLIQAEPLKIEAKGERQMEALNRGTVAVQTENGVFISWRLLGTEPPDLKFDVYKNGVLEAEGIDSINYQDPLGFAFDQYEVVPSGETREEAAVSVWEKNYIDVPVERPLAEGYGYTAEDVSVADLDGDGEYELILKWMPTNQKEMADHGRTGKMYLDAYRIDGTRLWRIDLGQNIRAGSYDAPFLCYDFDGDGKAEIVLHTAPGSKDADGKYVSQAGGDITLGENEKDYLSTGEQGGHMISGPDWLTVFDGLTGKALETVDYLPQRGDVEDWGDDYGGNASYYLAGVAYLNGTSPAIVFCRGSYGRVAVSAWEWNGVNLIPLWSVDSRQEQKLHGCGSGNLSIADVNQDGKDEILLGAVLIDGAGNVIKKYGDGYSQAVQTGDFNGDGKIEIFRLQDQNNSEPGARLYRADGELLADAALKGARKGFVANLDDSYGVDNSDAASLFWSDREPVLYDLQGKAVKREQVDMNAVAPGPASSLVYWDGDLSRELLSYGRILNYTVQEGAQEADSLEGTHDGNKQSPALIADLFGDWREEIIYPTADEQALRIFTTTQPTSYKLTTFLHDSQYRCAVAGQNTGIHRPPEISYYIGQRALKAGENYLKWERPSLFCPPKQQQRKSMEKRSVLFDTFGFEKSESDLGFSQSKVVQTNTEKGQVLQATGEEAVKLFSNTWPEVIEVYTFEWNGSELSLDVKNQGESPQELFLAAASYQTDGTLNGVQCKLVDLLPGEQKSKVYPLHQEQQEELKIMLWKKDSMEPLTPALTGKQPCYRNSAQRELISCLWKPDVNGGCLQVLDEKGERLLQINKEPKKAMTYSTEIEKAVTIDEALKQDGQWYSVQGVLDRENHRMELSVIDSLNNRVTMEILTGAGEHIGGIGFSKGGFLDVCRAGQVIDSQTMTPTLFEVTANGFPVVQCEITVGGKTVRTDQMGRAMVRLCPGDYDYTVSKNAYQTVYGRVEAGRKATVALSYGRMRTVYLQRKNQQGEDIGEAIPIGQAIENSWYIFSEADKADISQTDQEGVSLLFELDPDASELRQYVGQGGDAYLHLVYRPKKVPQNEGEQELLKIQFTPYGAGKEFWEGQVRQYKTAETKYALFSASEADSVSISLPEAIAPFAVEFDIQYEQLADGLGVGCALYADGKEQAWFGMQASGERKWILGSRQSGIYQPFPYVSADPRYTYAENWKNQWAHFILLFDKTNVYITVVNRTTGVCYVQDAKVPWTGDYPADQIVFGKTGADGTGIFGLSALKAYTVAAPELKLEMLEKEIEIPSETDCSIAIMHASETDTAFYNCFPVLNPVYILEDEEGNPVEINGVQLDKNGILTVGPEAEEQEVYYAVTKISGRPVQKIKIRYQKEAVLYESKFTGDTEGFQFKGGTNTAFYAEEGFLYFKQKHSDSSGEFYKEFDTQKAKRIKLQFTLKTGGVKSPQNMWEWAGEEYLFAVSLTGEKEEGQSGLLLEISQEYNEDGAQYTCYRTEGQALKRIGGDWEKTGDALENPLNGNVREWVITADMDFLRGIGIFELNNKEGIGYRKTIALGEFKNFNTLRICAEKKGQTLRWEPILSAVKLTGR